jgi:hypothetical protein
MSIFINIDICCRESSPQITQIDTDYKKNQCNLCNLWTFFVPVRCCIGVFLKGSHGTKSHFDGYGSNLSPCPRGQYC